MIFNKYTKVGVNSPAEIDPQPYTVYFWRKGCEGSYYYKAYAYSDVELGSTTGLGDTPEEACIEACELSEEYDNIEGDG